MKYLIPAFVATFYLGLAAAAAAAPCLPLDKPVDIAGTARAVSYTNAAGEPLTGMLIDFDQPVCIEGGETDVRYVQLFEIGDVSDGAYALLRGTISEIPTAHWYTSLVFQIAP